MAWIESHQAIKEHPKTYDLIDRLQVTKAQAVGHLHLFWWWCVDYAPEGNLSGFNDQTIARAGEWTGDAKQFVEALVEAGWLDRGDGVLTVHDWLDFCGSLMDKRLKRKELRRGSRTASDGSLPTNQTNQPNKYELKKERLIKKLREGHT